VFASLFSCQRTVLPIPSGRPDNKHRDNKKPGVERRVPPSHHDGETRCSTGFYPVFVLNLAPYVFLRAPMAGLQTPLRRNCLQPIT
jgi:hypothetical protein